LIVDDDPRNVRLLRRILSSEGYEVDDAFDGEEALEKAFNDPPDLILLDIMMPGMDGYEVCRRLREDERTVAVPIVMVTALSGKEEKAKALEVGADDFITKPFERIEILARVRSSLRVKKLHDQLVEAYRKLEEKNLLFESELMMARELQQALMTHRIPSIAGVELSYRYIPIFTVGGDFFFAEAVSESCLGLFVSDVMGHGPQAAMITAIIRTLLSELLPQDPLPSKLLRDMNERFASVMPRAYSGMFASAAYLRLDARSGELLLSTAGHPPPILLRSDGDAEMLETQGSTALGLMARAEYADLRLQLADGERVILYTDGLYEARNGKGEEFGMERVIRTIEKAKKLSGEKLVERLIEEVFEFIGKAQIEDDITVITLSYGDGR